MNNSINTEHNFYETAIATLQANDSKLALIIDRVGICTLNQNQHQGDVLDSLARSIIFQQLSTKSATAIYQRFLQLYDDQKNLNPEDILNTPDETLRGVGLSRQKIVYLKDLAQTVLTGLPTLRELNELSDETIVQTLIKIKGIGRWTVEMLLIFRLHRPDVLPVDDLGVRSAIRRIYDLPDLPNKKTVEQIGQAWKPYRTIAAWYLWRSLDLRPNIANS